MHERLSSANNIREKPDHTIIHIGTYEAKDQLMWCISLKYNIEIQSVYKKGISSHHQKETALYWP